MYTYKIVPKKDGWMFMIYHGKKKIILKVGDFLSYESAEISAHRALLNYGYR